MISNLSIAVSIRLQYITNLDPRLANKWQRNKEQYISFIKILQVCEQLLYNIIIYVIDLDLIIIAQKC